LIYLGQISYGLYVYHELSLLLSHYALGGYTNRAWGYALYWVVAVLLTILMAAVSYQLVERPFLKLKKRFTLVASRPI
jgi:peptidoglycan/LPS O-acetylase OafA/YrhL